MWIAGIFGAGMFFGAMVGFVVTTLVVFKDNEEE